MPTPIKTHPYQMKTNGEFKGTPGPWMTEEDLDEPRLDTIWHDEVLIARTCYAPASKANANLIAAAPELLEALINCQQQLWYLRSNMTNQHQINGLTGSIEIAQQAINKALGNTEKI